MAGFVERGQPDRDLARLFDHGGQRGRLFHPIAFGRTALRGRDRHEQRWDRHDDRRDWDRRGYDRRDYDRRDWDRRGERWGRHDNGLHKGWDRGRHNGYYYNNRWYYGPPPQAYYGNPYYRPGYAAWRRGAHLPPYYRGYVVNDYHRYDLRRPPRGHHWVRDDRGNYLLVAVATGIIADLLLHH